LASRFVFSKSRRYPCSASANLPGLELVVGDPFLRHRRESVCRESHDVIREQLKRPRPVAGLMVQPRAVELRLRQCRVRRVVGHPAVVLDD